MSFINPVYQERRRGSSLSKWSEYRAPYIQQLWFSLILLLMCLLAINDLRFTRKKYCLQICLSGSDRKVSRLKSERVPPPLKKDILIEVFILNLFSFQLMFVISWLQLLRKHDLLHFVKNNSLKTNAPADVSENWYYLGPTSWLALTYAVFWAISPLCMTT